MKYLMLIPLVFATSCASHRPKPVFLNLSPPPAVAPPGAVRYPEVVRAYHLGRYVDPNHPGEMHEQHDIYRVEAQSAWNLHPGPVGLVAPISVGALTNAAYSPVPVNDPVAAEVNRQRQITQTMLAEADRLTGALQQLGQAIRQTRSVARENQQLRQQLNTALKRLDSLQAEIRTLQGEPAPTNTPPDSPQSP